MNGLVIGLIAGVVFGTVSVLTMLPMRMQDKPRALLAAFASRFAIGFVIPSIALPLPGWAVGAAVGLLISLSDAIVTRAYAPILVFGTVGGALVGLAVDLLTPV